MDARRRSGQPRAMRGLGFASFGAGFWAHWQLAAWRELTGAHCAALCNCTRSGAESLIQEFLTQFTLAPGTAAVDPFKERRCHQGGGDRHDHHDREERGVNDPALETDVQDDQFHQAACVHQRAHRQGGTVVLAVQPAPPASRRRPCPRRLQPGPPGRPTKARGCPPSAAACSSLSR